MKITVVGMGKIGLPLAVQFARKGHDVFGADVNQKTVDLINSGKEPFPGESNLQEYLKDVVAEGKLLATLDTTEAVSKSKPSSWWYLYLLTNLASPISAGWTLQPKQLVKASRKVP